MKGPFALLAPVVAQTGGWLRSTSGERSRKTRDTAAAGLLLLAGVTSMLHWKRRR